MGEVALEKSASLKEEQGYLIREFLGQRIGRRGFIEQMVVLGVSSTGIAAILAACEQGTSGTSNTSGGVHKSKLVVATDATPPALDPHLDGGHQNGAVYLVVYEGISRWKSIPGPQPGSFDIAWGPDPSEWEYRLAESVDVSSDGLTYTYKLKKGVMSHAGNELTADDFKYTWDRGFALGGVSGFLNKVEGIGSVTAVDKYTVAFNLSEKSDSFPVGLCDYGLRAPFDSKEMKKHATSDDPWSKAWIRKTDAGFGPYAIQNLVPDQSFDLVAAKNSLYKAQTPRISFQAIPEAANRLSLLSTGAADVAETLTPTQLKSIEGHQGITIWNFGSNQITALPIVQSFPPLDNVKVRQALAYAIPYDAIVKQVYLGYGKPAYGPLSDHVPGLVDPSLFPYRYDLNKAKALMQEAGFANGFSTYYAYPNDEAIAEQLGIQLQTSFANLGVKLELRAMPRSTHEDTLYGGKAPITYSNLGADLPNPYYALSLFFGTGGAANFPKFSSPTVDALLSQAKAMSDPKQRFDFLRTKVNSAVIAESPWLWIVQPGYQLATRSNIQGVNWLIGETVWSMVFGTQ